MKAIGSGILDALTEAARQAPRLRKNYNLHRADESACHRLFNAVEPGSYIRPHRHLDTEKDETCVLIRGRIGVITFDEGGAVTGSAVLGRGGEVAIDIPHGQYHGAVSLEPGSILFEAKAGPYLPLSSAEAAPFAPEEHSPDAKAYLERLRGLFA